MTPSKCRTTDRETLFRFDQDDLVLHDHKANESSKVPSRTKLLPAALPALSVMDLMMRRQTARSFVRHMRRKRLAIGTWRCSPPTPSARALHLSCRASLSTSSAATPRTWIPMDSLSGSATSGAHRLEISSPAITQYGSRPMSRKSARRRASTAAFPVGR